MVDWKNRWPNFQPDEVLSPAGIRALYKGRVLLQPLALDLLQAFRKQIQKPILVNYAGMRYRGYRDSQENRSAGGKLHSYHVQGLAFDCTVQGMTPAELAGLAEMFGFMGVGTYDTFTHIDCRAKTNNVVDKWNG